MVSNPYALGFKADLREFGHTFDGNSKYKLVSACVCVRGLDQNPSTLQASVLFCVSKTRCHSLGQGNLGIYHPALTSQGLDVKTAHSAQPSMPVLLYALKNFSLPTQASASLP